MLSSIYFLDDLKRTFGFKVTDNQKQVSTDEIGHDHTFSYSFTCILFLLYFIVFKSVFFGFIGSNIYPDHASWQ